MLEIDRVAYEAEAQHIRQALKTWETAWAREHGGAKPGRDDIKGNDIAKQYTAYNRIRGILSGKVVDKLADKRPETQQPAKPKRKPDAAELATPSKRRAMAAAHETPSKSTGQLAAAATETPSISRKLFSPVVPTSIGPTPQRDGRVLGLFDVLASDDDAHQTRRQAMAATPSRRDSARDATPRKQSADHLALYHSGSDNDSDSDSDSAGSTRHGRRMGRTPMSSGRRNLLNHFTAPPRPPSFAGSARGALGTTPLKSRSANPQSAQAAADNANVLQTPSKARTAPVEFATPAFLRRQTTLDDNATKKNSANDNANDNDENSYFQSPPNKLRLPRKPLVRGLSSVLASLRKAEDDRLDEELAIMRELEGDADGQAPKAADDVAAAGDAEALEEQQLNEMEAQLADADADAGTRLLGGFDDEGLYDSEPEEAHDRGQPLRVYKKKGQKRTHRLVNMRPTRTKRAGPEVQAKPAAQAKPAVQPRGSDDGEGVDGGDGDGGDDDDYTDQASTTKSTAASTAKTAVGVVKKAARKVNELAHANFKRLKLKNTGTKGGPRFNSRFRRRR